MTLSRSTALSAVACAAVLALLTSAVLVQDAPADAPGAQAASPERSLPPAPRRVKNALRGGGAAPPPAARAPAAASPAPELLRYRFQAGELLRYAWSHTTSVAFTLETQAPGEDPGPWGAVAQGASSQRTELAMHGELVLQVLAATSERYELLLMPRDMQVRVAMDPGGTELIDPQGAASADPPPVVPAVRLTLGARGELLNLRYPPELDAGGHNACKLIASSLQVLLPETAEASWETCEDNVTGRYRARYDLGDEEQDAVRIAKTLLAYEQLTGHHGDVRALSPEDAELSATGSAAIVFDRRRGHLVRLAASEHTLAASELTRVAGETRVELELLERRRADAGELSAARELGESSDRAAQGSAFALALEDDDTPRAEPLAAPPVASLLQELQSSLRRDPPDLSAVQELYRRLVAAFAQGQGLDEALAAIRQGAFPERVLAHVLCALGDAPGPAAQETLLGVLRETRVPGREDTRLSAIVAAGFPQRPSSELVGELEDIIGREGASDPGRTALLAYGSLVANLKTTSSTRGETALQRLLALRTASPEPAWQRAWVLALENAAPQRFDLVRERLAEEVSPASRRAMLDAIGQSTYAGRGLTLLRATLQEPSAPGRQVAQRGLQRVQQDPLAARHALSEALADPDEGFRLQALEAFGPAVASDAEGRALLERAARQDPSRAVQQRARELG